jgi:hypothetical protein
LGSARSLLFISPASGFQAQKWRFRSSSPQSSNHQLRVRYSNLLQIPRLWYLISYFAAIPTRRHLATSYNLGCGLGRIASLARQRTSYCVQVFARAKSGCRYSASFHFEVGRRRFRGGLSRPVKYCNVFSATDTAPILLTGLTGNATILTTPRASLMPSTDQRTIAD